MWFVQLRVSAVGGKEEAGKEERGGRRGGGGVIGVGVEGGGGVGGGGGAVEERVQTQALTTLSIHVYIYICTTE